jgi:hypothetical protein
MHFTRDLLGWDANELDTHGSDTDLLARRLSVSRIDTVSVKQTSWCAKCQCP